MYERTEAAREMFYEERMEPKPRREGTWMLFPKDKVIRIAEPSGLEQVGGLLMKGDV